MGNINYNNESNQEIDFGYLLKIIINKKKFFLAIFGTLTFLSFIYNLNKKPIYQGSFEIVVKDNEKVSNRSISALLKNDNRSNDTQKTILSSPSVLLPVFELVKEYKTKKNINLKDFYFEDWLSNQIKINFKKDTSVLEVSALDTDKELILYTLNNISSKYQQYSKNISLQNLKRTIAFLEEEKINFEKKAKKSQLEFSKFSIENGLSSFYGLNDFNSSNRVSPESIISESEQKNSLNEQYSTKTVDSTKFANQRFKKQFSLLEKYESNYTDLSAKLKPNSNELKVLKNKIDNLKKYLERPTKILIQHGILKEKSSRDTALFYSVEDALALSKITLNKSPNPWEIISLPALRKEKVSPKIFKNIALSAAISALLGSIFSFLLYKKQGIVFFEEEIIRNSDFNFLETLYENDKQLNHKIINGIINKNKLSDQKIIMVFICRNTDFSSNSKKIMNIEKNVSFTTVSKLENIDKSSKIIFLLQKGFMKLSELSYFEKYINQIKDNVLGLCLIQESKLLTDKDFVKMNDLLES